MENYEKTIGIKTIYLTFVRRIKYVLLILIPLVIVSSFVTFFGITKTYQSSVSLSKSNVIAVAQYQIVQTVILDDEILSTTVSNLKNNGIVHRNNKEITKAEIKSGVSFATLSSSSISVTFSFQSTDKTIVQPVLLELSTCSIEQIKTKTGDTSYSISSPASPAKKNSKETTYFLIGIVASLLVSFLIPFVDEIISDEIYDKKDAESLGLSAFELRVSK